MRVQIILLEEDLENLKRFVKVGLSKDEKSDYIILHSIKDNRYITVLKARVLVDPDKGEEVERIFIYEGKPYILADTFTMKDQVTYGCDPDMSFEFHPVPDAHVYELRTAYSQIKCGLIKLHGCTDNDNKESVDEFFRLIKDMEKGELGDDREEE